MHLCLCLQTISLHFATSHVLLLTMDRCSHQILHEYHNSSALFSNILPIDSRDHNMMNSKATECYIYNKVPTSMTTGFDRVLVLLRSVLNGFE